MERILNQMRKVLFDQSRRSVLLFGILLCLLLTLKRRKRKRKRHNNKAWNYKLLKQMIKDNNVSVPAMFIDLDCFEQNVKILASIANKHNKTLRIATKSIRCPYLIQHALKISNGTLKGFMCFSVQEANALIEYAQEQKDTDTFSFQETFNDFLIAYPTVEQRDIETAYKLTQKGINISLMIDCVEHIHIINEICHDLYYNTPTSNDTMHKMNVCIDLDMTFRIKSVGVRFGAHRSNVSDEYDLNCILDGILKSKFIQLSGVMGYEASVAEQPDNSPYHSTLHNYFIRRMKSVFQDHCNEERQSFIEFINNKIDAVADEYKNDNNLSSFAFVNGGGTGNIHIVSKNRFCTEVTAGSGMIQPTLCDYYIHSQCQPAAAFALQITRIAVDEKYVMCKSGGFIASGAISKDKAPVPFLPKHQVYGPFDAEGFGEVQTPLRVKDASIFDYGDVIFFRAAKAGEIAERFNEYILKRGSKIEQRVPTYRGMGYAFY